MLYGLTRNLLSRTGASAYRIPRNRWPEDPSGRANTRPSITPADELKKRRSSGEELHDEGEVQKETRRKMIVEIIAVIVVRNSIRNYTIDI